MSKRQEFNRIIAELKEDMKKGPVEILTGPCAPLVVKDAKSLHEYSCRLDSWMFPVDLPPFLAQ
jgi:hypothetical protein